MGQLWGADIIMPNKVGRPPLPSEIKKHKVNFWITWEEKEKIKEYIKQIRA